MRTTHARCIVYTGPNATHPAPTRVDVSASLKKLVLTAGVAVFFFLPFSADLNGADQHTPDVCVIISTKYISIETMIYYLIALLTYDTVKTD